MISAGGHSSNGDGFPIEAESLRSDPGSAAFRRQFEEARARTDAIHRAERDRSDFEEKSLRAELERLRNDRESERQAHRDELAALHDAWEAERRGWREQLDAAYRQAHLERDSARAADARLRTEGDAHASLSVEREARSSALETLAATLVREAEDRLLVLSALHRERDELRDEVEAGRSGHGWPLYGQESAPAPAPDSESIVETLRLECEELSRTNEILKLALDDAEAAAREAAPAFAERLAGEHAKVDDLNRRLEAFQAEASRRTDRLPILARDLAKWSSPTPLPPVATILPQSPPTAEDLSAADQQVEMLRKLIRTLTTPDRPLHTLFDESRLLALQSRLRESALLAERLFNQIERSRSSKDLLWHLMVAQRTEELNRTKRR